VKTDRLTHVRPPVKRELTANDYLYAWKRLLDPKVRSPYLYYVEGRFVGADAVHKSDLLLGATADPRFVYPAHWTYGARFGVRGADERWSVSLFGRNLGNENEPVTLFGGPSFIPPGAVPFLPNGQINGVSGWMSPASLRQVGLSLQASW